MRLRNVPIVIALVVACAGAALAEEYAVRNVTDGDTVELANGSKVRYLGIDTPEVREKRGGTWVYAPEPFAEKAKAFNADLVAGKKVRLEFDERREDKFNRLLAYVYVNGTMVNEELLRAGCAITYIIPPNFKHTDRLVAAQEEAMKARNGLWSSAKTFSAAEAEKHIDEIASVTGTVTDIYRSGKGVFLKIDGGAFTAVIYSQNLVLFEERGIMPEREYDRKRVTVTGKIRYYKGPEIIAGHPFQIKVSD